MLKKKRSKKNNLKYGKVISWRRAVISKSLTGHPKFLNLKKRLDFIYRHLGKHE